MQEYRTRLTATVVTGKLDVRPAAEDAADQINDPLIEVGGADETHGEET